MSSPNLRDAVRAILLSPDRHVLLMRIREPGAARGFWITPGGGIQADETDAMALKRELAEELGLGVETIGAPVWHRDHTFNWRGRRLRQRERIYLIECARFEPKMSDADELQVLQEFRWWSLDELAATVADVTPCALSDIVDRYLRDGRPATLPPVEVRID